MSYARKSEGDVYVYGDISDRKGELRCCDCTLLLSMPPVGGVWEGSLHFIAASHKDMIAHLKEHQAVGHRLPKYAFDRLKKEAKNPTPKYPVHYGTHEFMKSDGSVGDSLLGTLPLCGYLHRYPHLKENPVGYAHHRDAVTQDPKGVTCKHCKDRLKAGITAYGQPLPEKTKKKRAVQ